MYLQMPLLRLHLWSKERQVCRMIHPLWSLPSSDFRVCDTSYHAFRLATMSLTLLACRAVLPRIIDYRSESGLDWVQWVPNRLHVLVAAANIRNPVTLFASVTGELSMSGWATFEINGDCDMLLIWISSFVCYAARLPPTSSIDFPLWISISEKLGPIRLALKFCRVAMDPRKALTMAWAIM